MSALTLDGVACSSPDGTLLFSGLTLSVERGLVGIVGRNGSGKSTLLHAIAGEVPVAAGTIHLSGTVGLLRQLPVEAAATVAEVLAVGEALDLLERIESGAAAPEDHERAQWDLPARLESALASVGLPSLDVTRPIDTLSGGERTRLMLAALLLPKPDIILLDEPTNNLDEDGRAAVAELVDRWSGPALVATHDRDLLRRADRIVELTGAGVHVVGGGWDLFEEVRSAERLRAAEAAEKAAAEVESSKREKQREAEKQARRDKRGRAVAAKAIDPKIYLGAQKRRAEATAARYRAVGEEIVERAKDSLDEARARVERVVPVRIELPPSGLPARHVLVEARDIIVERGGRPLFGPLDLSVVGPERIAIVGRNGVGKTSLIRAILGLEPVTSGDIRADRKRMAMLDQHLSLLDPEETLLEAMQRLNLEMSRQEAHQALAAYGFRNALAARRSGSLSGGERVRLALACLFSRPEPPQMLILDEPTNHLDLAATEQLEEALASYDGAILCVSHDPAFREALAVSREIALTVRHGDTGAAAAATNA
jgi:ATPase subunit of ABC transporter with duplicated ATPase domains